VFKDTQDIAKSFVPIPGAVFENQAQRLVIAFATLIIITPFSLSSLFIITGKKDTAGEKSMRFGFAAIIAVIFLTFVYLFFVVLGYKTYFKV
jgi:hypothetical protein